MSKELSPVDTNVLIMDEKSSEETKVDKTVSFAGFGKKVNGVLLEKALSQSFDGGDTGDESRGIISRDSVSEHDADDEDDDEDDASSSAPNASDSESAESRRKHRPAMQDSKVVRSTKKLPRKRSSRGETSKARRKSTNDGMARPSTAVHPPHESTGHMEAVLQASAARTPSVEPRQSEGEDNTEAENDESNSDDDNVELEAKVRNPKIVDSSPTGRYVRFNELLGEGSFKKVYLAYDTQQGVEVAWNMVKVSNLKKSAQQRIVQEMQILQTLNHEHIIKFYASWLIKDTQSVVFVTEMMSSGTLKDFIQNRPVRLRIVKRWCRHILHALIYLHEENDPAIIHRDLKCDNIFINGATGDIRIGDMGLASWQRTGNAKSVLGTPEYMAPEMFEENYDEKVDIYAFGMCILEMITKETPYLECSSTPQIYKKVMDGILPEAYHSIIDCPAKAFIYECIKTPEPGCTRPAASELRTRPFLRKTDNDPTDDIDCRELLKDGRERLARLEKKDSTTSLPTRDDRPEEGLSREPGQQEPRKFTPSAAHGGGNAASSAAAETRKKSRKANHVLFPDVDKEEVNDRANKLSPLASHSHTQKADKPVPVIQSTTDPNTRQQEQSVPSSVDVDSDSPAGVSDPIAKGAEVEARFGGDGDWFAGKIQKVNKDGSFGIKYHDHDYEDAVAPGYIRITLASGQKMPLPEYLAQSNTRLDKPRLNTHNSAEAGLTAADVEESQMQMSRMPSSRSLHSDPGREHSSHSSGEVGGVDLKESSPIAPAHKSTGSTSPEEGTESSVPRWSMVAKNAGDDNSPRSELTILFSYHNGPSAMFPFDIDQDQASAVAAELVETLKLPASELDSIALNLLQFRHEYESWRVQNPDSEFRLTVERDQNTRVTAAMSGDTIMGSHVEGTGRGAGQGQKQSNGSTSAGGRGQSVGRKTQEEIDAEELTDDEIAEYDRQIAQEQETYRQIQAEHEERINEIKRRKEERRSQQQQRLSLESGKSGGSALEVEARSRAASTHGQHTGRTAEDARSGTKFKIVSDTEQKTKDQLRREAAEKIKAEKEYIRKKNKEESQTLEAKINRLEGFSLNEPVNKSSSLLGTSALGTAQPVVNSSVGMGTKPGMTLNEKRHKHQLDALESRQKAIQIQSNVDASIMKDPTESDQATGFPAAPVAQHSAASLHAMNTIPPNVAVGPAIVASAPPGVASMPGIIPGTALNNVNLNGTGPLPAAVNLPISSAGSFQQGTPAPLTQQGSSAQLAKEPSAS